MEIKLPNGLTADVPEAVASGMISIGTAEPVEPEKNGKGKKPTN